MNQTLLGKILYGTLFVLVLPLALAAWSRGLATHVELPTPQASRLGACAILIGLATLLLAMWTLWKRGEGLPMNAYPPTRFVSTGIYALLPHPIYGAFIVLCAGTSIWYGSAAGLWVVTPVVAMASAALVAGYELPDLRRRFGSEVRQAAFLPPADALAPTWLVRLRCYVTVLLPWFVLYEACVAKGVPPDARGTALSLDASIPFLPWTEAIYATPYLVVAAVPLLLRTNRTLREFSRQALVSFIIVFPLLFAVPLVTGLSLPIVGGRWADLVRLERQWDSTACALPSYHVVWAFIAAGALAGKSRIRQVLWFAWAGAISLSCLTTKAHTILDVVAGFVTYLLVANSRALWHAMLRVCERLANSWKEWRFGPVRIINHGGYAGAAVAVYIFLINGVLGPGHPMIASSIFLAGVIGAALWAQFIEGSPALLRPLGFYGGMIATIVVVLFVRSSGVSTWTVLAAVCFAAPALQGIGRLRCFVQGCCHGAPTDQGIRYTHPRSRVVRIAGFAGMPVHPTQLYSMLGNLFTALVLTRLLTLRVTCGLLCGMYLILSGLFRFVEENLRGEPQTPVHFGLRLYQWLAVASIVSGAIITTLPTPSVPGFHMYTGAIWTALGCGLGGWFVSGVDFPESNRRFARLT
jgi:protein-S-isoprenylcysteine O-methyltransferase Ste14